MWDYVAAENIPVVSLYFAAEHTVLRRNGSLIMRDNDRMPPYLGEKVR